ncbi:MAG: crotonase/enoyl-CoA hydratase family protein [Burkholderiaceae bacterium]
MKFSTLDYQITDRLLQITLNRPDQMNSFTVEMANELVRAFEIASEDDNVGAVVVTGAGRAFCAGMDLTATGNVFGLNESLKPTLTDMHERLDEAEIIEGVRDTGGRVVLAIYNCKKPVIAAINGAAVGIGATMTLAMDIRLVSSKARIGFVFGKIGVTPEACSTWFLPRLVGMQQALDWVYSAELIDADEAVASGLAKAQADPEALLDQARTLARRYIENRSPVAIALARQMMLRNASLPSPLEAHKVDSLAIYYASLKDGKEGVAAFREKRAPAFSSKASEMPDFYPWW